MLKSIVHVVKRYLIVFRLIFIVVVLEIIPFCRNTTIYFFELGKSAHCGKTYFYCGKTARPIIFLTHMIKFKDGNLANIKNKLLNILKARLYICPKFRLISRTKL